MEHTIGISLIAFKKVHQFTEFYNEVYPSLEIKPVFELSYKMNSPYLQRVADLNVPVASAHIPCPHTNIMPNLGSSDPAVVQESMDVIRQSAETAAGFDADILVLHSGYATDSRIYTDFALRSEHLEKETQGFENFLIKQEGKVSSDAYCETSKYRKHLELTMKNLPRAVAIGKEYGVSLAIENLNPRITYLMQRPQDLLYTLAEVPGVYMCLDFGHLWLSSIVHGFSYFEAIIALLDSGRVITTHVHNNYSVPENIHSLSDSHHGLDNGNIPYSSVFKLLNNYAVDRLILETEESPVESIKLLTALAAL